MPSKSKNKTKILFIIYLHSHFSSLWPLINLLKKGKKYEPVLLFNENYLSAFGADKALKLCKEERVDVINFLGHKIKKINRQADSVYKTKTHQILHQIYLKLSQLSLINILINPIIWFQFVTYRLKKANAVLEQIKPGIIVFAEENAVYMTTIFSKVAKKYAIPTVIIPHTLAKEKKELAESLYHTHEIKNLSEKLAAKLFPKWAIRYKNKKLLLNPYPKILIMELLGLAPVRPWQINGGFSDLIAVDSQFMYDFSIKNKFLKEKLVVIGSINDDLIFQVQKNLKKFKEKLKKKFNFDDKPILLCALPSDQSGRVTEFANYKAILDFWVTSLQKIKNYNVVLNLHPNTLNETREYIEAQGLNLDYSNIAQLIPLCDIYLACVSATIRWAIACGKPVINYDIYKYRYGDYDQAKAVVTVETKEDFSKVLKKITQDPKYFRQLQADQELIAKQWGMLDGKSGQRTINLFDKLIKEKKDAQY